LFYQFLGASDKWGDDAPDHVALDSMTFCSSLGPEEANKQLRRHWKTWVTEEDIKSVKMGGADTLRIPVGDWMLVQLLVARSRIRSIIFYIPCSLISSYCKRSAIFTGMILTSLTSAAWMVP
jgi:hypothetical protein